MQLLISEKVHCILGSIYDPYSAPLGLWRKFPSEKKSIKKKKGIKKKQQKKYLLRKKSSSIVVKLIGNMIQILTIPRMRVENININQNLLY